MPERENKHIPTDGLAIWALVVVVIYFIYRFTTGRPIVDMGNLQSQHIPGRFYAWEFPQGNIYQLEPGTNEYVQGPNQSWIPPLRVQGVPPDVVQNGKKYSWYQFLNIPYRSQAVAWAKKRVFPGNAA